MVLPVRNDAKPVGIALSTSCAVCTVAEGVGGERIASKVSLLVWIEARDKERERVV
jgi:hypothetical protein